MSEPLRAFRSDREKARALGDPWADLCVLASVDEGSGRLRVLVLRELGDELGIFYNAHSPKAHQIDASPHSELATYFDSIKVQYRLAAQLLPMPRSIIETHWPKRPAVSKKLDWLYERMPQGSPIDPSSSLDQLLEDSQAQDTPPPSASGALLRVLTLERLLLNPDGAHRRELFDVVSGTQELLVP